MNRSALSAIARALAFGSIIVAAFWLFSLSLDWIIG